MSVMVSQITGVSIVCSIVVQAQIKENIKAPCHWPLCGEFTGEFPAQKACNAEKVSSWVTKISWLPVGNTCLLLTYELIVAGVKITPRKFYICHASTIDLNNEKIT